MARMLGNSSRVMVMKRTYPGHYRENAQPVTKRNACKQRLPHSDSFRPKKGKRDFGEET